MVNRLVRYLRSPEFVLAVANFALMVAFWGYQWLDVVEEPIVALYWILPFSNAVNAWVVRIMVSIVWASLMLPVLWFYDLALTIGVVAADEFVLVRMVWWSLPNSVLWGFMIAFLFRLVRTGSVARARAATLRWRTGSEEQQVTSE